MSPVQAKLTSLTRPRGAAAISAWRAVLGQRQVFTDVRERPELDRARGEFAARGLPAALRGLATAR